MIDRRRPLWPLLIAALIGLPVLYVASFGPFVWLLDGGRLPKNIGEPLLAFYRPMCWAVNDAPQPIRNAVWWYVQWWYPWQ